MIHIALYNIEKHLVEAKASFEPDAEVELPGGASMNAADYEVWRLGIEIANRGTINGEWRIYRGDSAFSWTAVTPVEPAE